MSKKHKLVKTKIYVEKLVPGGSALGSFSTISSTPSSLKTEQNKKIFIWNALPEETVTSILLTKQKSSYLEGIALEIENPSSHRVKERDACFLSTSPWQIFDYHYELEQKRLLVEESLREAHISLPNSVSVAPVITDNNEWHYRNKMEYSLYWDKEQEKIFLAFHARGSHQKLPVESSNLERPEILKKAQEIVDSLNKDHEPAFKYQSLLLRANQEGIISGGLLENGCPHPSFSNLTDSILGHFYSYSPNGFFQINLPVYELALNEIKKHIKTNNVLDLYSGVGTIGLSVARDKNLTLVESNKSAFAELTRNIKLPSQEATTHAKENRIHAVLAKSEEALTFIIADQTVILDPPRSGCDKKLLEKLLEKTPKTIIYLSCNPSTQARDISILLSTSAYKITSVTPFNFFPKTPHIENLIILTYIGT